MELLVAMAVIVALASIALIVVPDVMTQDRTTDGAGTVRQTLMIARARAQRDGGLRGVRFLIGPDPTNLAKTNAGAVGELWSTELQYVEQPPPLVPEPGERIEVEYLLDNNQALISPPGVYYMNVSPNIQLFIKGEIEAGRAVELRVFHNDELIVLTVIGPLATPIAADPTDPRRTARVGPNNYELAIDWNRSSASQLMLTAGAGQTLALANFWLNRPPEPLMGEPTVQLPRNVCVDLNAGVSRPGFTSSTLNYDILFKPSGQVEAGGVAGDAGQIFLWVRDYTKVADMRPAATAPDYQYAGQDQFQRGGEQQVVALKTRSGSLGVYPVLWPQADGTYPFRPGSTTVRQDPYTFAAQGGP